jgi:chemotaxis protein CheD
VNSALATQTPAWEPEPRKIHVIQGEFHVSDGEDVIMTTILGSCVAACIRDARTGVGGMNHFLLPGTSGDEGMRYGVQSMELLVNALLRLGARRERLEVKLFGGAHLFDGLADVGAQNSAFAERFLKDEGLTYLGGSLRGDRARRIQYWPQSGRARQILLAPTESKVFAAERRAPKPTPAADDGGLELF